MKNTIQIVTSQEKSANSTHLLKNIVNTLVPGVYANPRTWKARDFKHYTKRVTFNKWSKCQVIPLAESQQELLKQVERLTDSTKRVYEYIIYMRSQGLANFASQAHIASKLGVSLKTVNRAVQTLWSLKLIDVYHRGRMQSNIMRPADMVTTKQGCELLMRFLPICRSIFLSYLLIAPIVNYDKSLYYASDRYMQKNVSLYKKDEEIIKDLLGMISQNNFLKEDKRSSSLTNWYRRRSYGSKNIPIGVKTSHDLYTRQEERNAYLVNNPVSLEEKKRVEVALKSLFEILNKKEHENKEEKQRRSFRVGRLYGFRT